jgi:hypothetical protein
MSSSNNAININTSGFNFSELVPASSSANGNNSETSNNSPTGTSANAASAAASFKESKYKKSKRKQIVSQYREDNIEDDAIKDLAKAMGLEADKGIDDKEAKQDSKHKQRSPEQDSKHKQDSKPASNEIPITQQTLQEVQQLFNDAISELEIKDDILVDHVTDPTYVRNLSNTEPGLNATQDSQDVSGDTTVSKKAKKKAPAKRKTGKSTKNTKLGIDLTEEEEEVEKNKRIIAIQRYQQNALFGDYLAQMGCSYSGAALNNKSLEELDKILLQMRTFCENRVGNNGLDGLLFGATGMTETIVSKTSKYNITG